jgi:uncharacterized protein YabE (DUF348 family)
LVFLFGCQSSATSTVTILEGNQVRVLTTSAAPLLASLLAQGGVVMGPADRVLLRGLPVHPGQQLPNDSALTLQIQRAVSLTVNGKEIQTAAPTVGQALAEAGFELYAADKLDPPADTPSAAGMAVTYVPSQLLVVTVDGRQIDVRSSAETVGAVLAEAGVPLLGLDTSRPGEDQSPPKDGRIRVTRVSEALVLAQRTIPYGSTFQQSAEIPLGQEKILQPGIGGLAVTRLRIRYENGSEVSRKTELEAIVRPPQNRLVAQGSKIVAETISVGGATFQYWRVMQMYATVYSPCESGTCSYGTASGLRAGKGVVAVDPDSFTYLNGQRVYISGYGYAVIGDLGNGLKVQELTGVSRYKWIDLGFDDNNMPDMTGWVTVYFLEPAPATIPNALK